MANRRAVVQAARKAGIQVFYVPHHRARPDDLHGWQHPSPYLLGASRAQVFAVGAWGGEWHPDYFQQFAAELGYHVTLVRDATAAFSAQAMHAAHEINGPTFAHAILTTAELIAAIGSP